MQRNGKKKRQGKNPHFFGHFVFDPPADCTGGVSKLDSATVHVGVFVSLFFLFFLSQAAIPVFSWFLMAAPHVFMAPGAPCVGVCGWVGGVFLFLLLLRIGRYLQGASKKKQGLKK
jgi:hypothetical protein